MNHLGDSNEILKVCKERQFGSPVKIWADSLKGFRRYGGLNLRSAFSANFQRILKAKLYIRWERVLMCKRSRPTDLSFYHLFSAV